MSREKILIIDDTPANIDLLTAALEPRGHEILAAPGGEAGLKIAAKARLMTDESGIYKRIGKAFGTHETVNHSAKEYSHGDVTTNTVESSFALLKCGLTGVFYSIGEQHLQRYVTEFDFRWNTRQKLGFSDTDRAAIVLKNIGGKRLTYRRTDA